MEKILKESRIYIWQSEQNGSSELSILETVVESGNKRSSKETRSHPRIL